MGNYNLRTYAQLQNKKQNRTKTSYRISAALQEKNNKSHLVLATLRDAHYRNLM